VIEAVTEWRQPPAQHARIAADMIGLDFDWRGWLYRTDLSVLREGWRADGHRSVNGES
jgi:hypothetical protein